MYDYLKVAERAGNTETGPSFLHARFFSEFESARGSLVLEITIIGDYDARRATIFLEVLFVSF